MTDMWIDILLNNKYSLLNQAYPGKLFHKFPYYIT